MPDQVTKSEISKVAALTRLAAAVVSLTWALAASATATAQSTPSAIEGDFQIGRDGRLMVVPVRLRDREILCLLDTGASLTGFDVRLRDALGKTIGIRVVNAPGALRRVESYDWPKVTIGGRALRSVMPVISIDLENVHRASNEKIYGVIGMDVLRSCRLQIDFDQGRLRFLKALPRDTDELGEQLPLRIGQDGVPYLRGSIGDESEEWFVIDSGALGNSLQADVFDELLEQRQIQLGATSASMTVAGEMRGDRGKIAEFRVGRFMHQHLRFSRANMSSVGLRYLSRFRVLFDFPNECVYLREGSHYERPEPRATSGLTLNWIEGAATVASVTKNGAGAKAGVKPGDVFVSVGGKPAAAFDPFALRELLTSDGGKRVPLTILRGKHEIDVVIVLDDDRKMQP